MKQEVEKLYLVESFYSIQGEGRFAGTPSVFLRFGGCNLNCAGFGVEQISPLDGSTLLGCDSIRATFTKHYKHLWKKIASYEDIVLEVQKHLKNSCKPDIVITGGEPLLHHDNPIMIEFLSIMIKKGYKITFETNATIMIDFEKYPIYHDITFAMSVKLKNSGESYQNRIYHDRIKNLALNSKDSFFKFVIDKQTKDNSEIKDIVGDLKLPIYCMPKGATSRELSYHDRYVADFCINFCYNYCDRMHIRLWDNMEGK